jgi:ribonuclease BN (tRNA processing enzyme)
MEATKIFHQHKEGEIFRIYDLTITSKGMKHPGGSYSYKIKENEKTIIFGSDAEFRLDSMNNLEPFIDYFRDADILIFDTQYTFEEQLTKIDWGHSSAAVATDLSLKANVKNLVMFHHDPAYSDEILDEVYLRAIRYKDMLDPENQSNLKIHIAYEGMELFV